MIKTIKNIIKWFLLIGGVLFYLSMIVLYVKPDGKYYDCSLAEISPDFPIEVRNECRRLRSVQRV